MGKAKTLSFILELGLEINAHEEAELNKRFEAARQLYNACLSEAKRRLFLLRQSKEYQQVRSMPRTENGKPNKVRTEAFKALNAKFGFSEYDLHLYVTKIRNSCFFNHIDSTTTQKLATRAFKAVQRIAFGQAKKVRFKGKNQLKSVEGKSNKTGIRYKDAGYIEWLGLKLNCIIDVNDKVVVHGLSSKVKYCRIIKRIFNGKTRFFVQLILEGIPYQKFKAKDKTVGLDIGPSTIAYVSDDNASLERFCDELKDKQKEIRRLQRKLERQRRANALCVGLTRHSIRNRIDEHKAQTYPKNYIPDGTIKPPELAKDQKTWHESTRLKITKRKLAELQRKLAAHRKTLHGNLTNRILKLGKYIKTEKLSYKAFQKNYGKSVKDRAPGMFMEILRRKAENAGGFVDEFSTKDTKLSQYCHKCGKYNKKPLSQRVHTCCNLNIQRDLYSAFLAGSVRCVQPRTGAFAGLRLVENTDEPTSRFILDTADVHQRWRSTEAVLQRAVSHISQVANGRQLPFSFGMVNPLVEPSRDRAARPRSSDAPDVQHREIPDTKAQDVVAVQLWLF